jgi:putative phosphoesterase
MPVAIISDIHGNLIALDAVLNAIEGRHIKQIICLGDVASTGPQPCEVIARLKEIGCPVVRGSTDSWLLRPRTTMPDNSNAQRIREQRIQDMDLWASKQLTAEDRAYLASFPYTLSYELENGKRLLAYHGSPISFHDHILPTTPDYVLETVLNEQQADVYIGGHTHMQMFRRFRRSLMLNPGSVGLAFDHASPFNDGVHHPPWAEYAIIDTPHDGLNVELHRVPFDVQAFIQITLASGMPQAEWSAGHWSTIEVGTSQ